MKKIILGCAAVLLSLGLLAGCNNKEVEEEPPIEEAVVITIDSSASVVVGESLSLTYTVSPEKAEVVAASDNEDVVTAVAQSGTLYLEGVAEGSAIVTLVGTYEGYASANKNINVSVITKEEEDTEPGVPGTGGEGEPETTAVTLTLTTSTLSLTLPEQGGTAEAVKFDAYTVTPEGADVLGDTTDTSIISVSNLEDGCYITPLAEGEATVTLTAEYTSDEGVEYTPDSAELKVIVSEYTAPEPEPEPDPFESYTVELTLKTSTGAAFPDPDETYSVWIQSDYDGSSNSDWGSEHLMTYEGEGVYTYTYEDEPGWTSDSYSAAIHAGYNGAVVWGEAHQFGTITIQNPTSESGAVTGQFEVISYIGDDWETIFDFGSDVNFYLLLVDTSSTDADAVSTSGYWHTGGTYFGEQNWCASTITTTGTSNKSCLYNATVGIAPSGTSDWFTITTDDSGWGDEIGYGTIDIEEPTNENDCVIFVANVDLSKLGTSTKQQNISYTRVEATDIATYIGSI